MSSPTPNITIVKKKEKSSFGLPLSTIGKKSGAKLASSPRRGEALSLIHISPAGSPTASPPTSPRSFSASPRGPQALASPRNLVAVDELDEPAFHDFVAERMNVIHSIADADHRRIELEALQTIANKFTLKLLSEKEQAEKEQEERARKEAHSHSRKKIVSTQLSQISENDVLAYEQALRENKQRMEEEALREAERQALLRSRIQVGEIVYAEYVEDKLWYLAKVLVCDGKGGATVE
jgi:hypothetical protein